MTDKAFVDTNILVYAHDRGSGAKHAVATDLVRRLWIEQTGYLSTQVVQEFYINVRRKARNPISSAEARGLVEDYLNWHLVINDGETILHALDLEKRYQVSFWDALILRSAQLSGAPILYSEDLSNGQTYGRVRVVNPFVDPP